MPTHQHDLIIPCAESQSPATPPAARVTVAADSVEDSVAAFVLNYLTEPGQAWPSRVTQRRLGEPELFSAEIRAAFSSLR